VVVGVQASPVKPGAHLHLPSLLQSRLAPQAVHVALMLHRSPVNPCLQAQYGGTVLKVLITQYEFVKIFWQSVSAMHLGLLQSAPPKDSVGQTQTGEPLLETQTLLDSHRVVSQVGGDFKVHPVMVLAPLELGVSPVAMYPSAQIHLPA